MNTTKVCLQLNIILRNSIKKQYHARIPNIIDHFSSIYLKENISKPSMATDKKLHIAMFPWLAFGHIIPYLELCKRIARKGHHISFISTPHNIHRLPKLHPDLSPFISFINLPLSPIDHLPQNAESTSDIPSHEVHYLKKAYDELKEPLVEILQFSNPDWILFDFAPYWICNEIGPKLGIKTAFFSIFTLQGLSLIGPPSEDEQRKNPDEFSCPPKWVTFPAPAMVIPEFQIKQILNVKTSNITGVSDLYRVKTSVRKSDIVVIRGNSPELEHQWIQLLEHIFHKPIFPIGSLPATDYDFSDESPAWGSMKEWLEKQAKGSVVYVAFGSEAKLSQLELTELAFGLELSELPFFWVLTTRCGPTDPDPIELPDGFEERTRGRGFVCRIWAPQLKILSHDSVGGFLSHGGCSSVVEAIQFEKALICIALTMDQGMNARDLEEKKMCYCVPRNEMDGSFTRNSVSESLKMVMVEEEGKVYRERIKEMKDLYVNEARDDALLDHFLDYLKIHSKADGDL